MANRRPLVNIAGALKEMPVGDYVDPACEVDLWTYVKVTSDFTVNNTAMSPTGFSGIALAASTQYEYEIVGACSGSTAATGWRYGTSTLPSGATSWWTAQGPYNTDANGRSFVGTGTTVSSGSGLVATGTAYPFFVKGNVVVTTAGNITFAFTGTVANILTIKAGTFLKYRALP